MMNKVFFMLLILTVAGAGLLFWLLRSMPQSIVADPHASKDESHVIAKPDGVEIKEGGASPDEKPAAHGETATDKKETAEEAKHDSHEGPVLKIETEPVKAVVFVDGEMVGQTPLEIALKNKEQQVKLEAAGFKDVQREAPAIKANMDLDTLTWKIVLRAQPGSLKKSPRAETVSEVVEGEPKKHPAKTKAPVVAKTAPVAAAKPKAVSAPKAASKEDADLADLESASRELGVTEAAKENPANVLYLSGKSGPVWIQIQAMPAAQKDGVEKNIREYRQALNLNVMGCTVSVKGQGDFVRILTGPFDTKAAAKKMLKPVNTHLKDPGFITGVQECQ